MQQNDSIKNLIDCWNAESSVVKDQFDERMTVEFWNKSSGNFAKNIDEERRRRRTQDILEFLEDAGFKAEGSKVLDIGCGPGTLSLPLARMGADVTSLDFSPAMLERLMAEAERESLDVKPVECSWWNADIDELGFRRKFDLVLASMTPGVIDYESFGKMMACSKDLCYYSNFVGGGRDRAHDALHNFVHDLVSPQEKGPGRKPLNHPCHHPGNGLLFPFMYLYLSGYSPSVKINNPGRSNGEMKWEDAADREIGLISRNHGLDDEKKEKIRDYFRNTSQDGMCVFRSFGSTGMMIWKVSDE